MGNIDRSLLARFFLLISTFVLLLFVAVTVGGGRDADNLREEILIKLAPIRSELSFKPIVPSYLPAGTLPEPRDVPSGGQDQLNFNFRISSDEHLPPEQRAFVNITEIPVSQASDSYGVNGPNPQFRREFAVMEGHDVGITRTTPARDLPAVAFATTIGDLVIQVGVEWSTDDSLSDAMYSEALKVFQSILEGQSKPSPATSGHELRKQISAEIQASGFRPDFDPVVPSYLPPDVKLEAVIQNPDNGRLDIAFLSSRPLPESPDVVPIVEFSEYKSAQAPPKDAETMVIQGHEVAVVESDVLATAAVIQIYGQVNEIQIIFGMKWQNADNAVFFTQEMEREAIKVFASLIDN